MFAQPCCLIRILALHFIKLSWKKTINSYKGDKIRVISYNLGSMLFLSHRSMESSMLIGTEYDNGERKKKVLKKL